VFAVRAAPVYAGPPFVTDDPEPTDYRQWEIYLGLQYENAGASVTQVPFAEFNYGALRNVQVSASIPLDDDSDSGVELGIKTRFVQESAHSPQVSFYPSIALPPSGRPGYVQTYLPIYAQKTSGKWTAFGGGGLYLNAGPGERNSTFVGGALERTLSTGTTIGTELYHQSASIPNGPSLTGASIGTIFQLGTHHAVLFSFGHALAGGDRFSAYGSYEIHT
jgi:hypothetical protein